MSKPICLFCNGRFCKYENYERWLDVPNCHPAIKGLYSNWITNDIIAMARPSERAVKEHGIVEQFQTNRVKAIFNLQQAGEHEICGDGLAEGSGFSYRPETFMDAGVYFYNFGWKDMTTPTLPMMLNIVQVVAFHIQRGERVAVHCHAGLGRTGLVIACSLLYAEMRDPMDAVLTVRVHRPGSIQTERQLEFVKHFHRYLLKLRQVFAPDPASRFDAFSLLKRQRECLHGQERKKLQFVPKIVHEVCMRLTALARLDQTAVAGALTGSDSPASRSRQAEVLKLDVNAGRWAAVHSEKSASVLQILLLDWLAHLKKPTQSVRVVSTLQDADINCLVCLSAQEPILAEVDVDALLGQAADSSSTPTTVLSMLSQVASSVLVTVAAFLYWVPVHRWHVCLVWAGALTHRPVPKHLLTESPRTPAKSSDSSRAGTPLAPRHPVHFELMPTPPPLSSQSFTSVASSAADAGTPLSDATVRLQTVARFLVELATHDQSPAYRRASAAATSSLTGAVLVKAGSSLLIRSLSLAAAPSPAPTPVAPTAVYTPSDVTVHGATPIRAVSPTAAAAVTPVAPQFITSTPSPVSSAPGRRAYTPNVGESASALSVPHSLVSTPVSVGSAAAARAALQVASRATSPLGAQARTADGPSRGTSPLSTGP